MFALIASEGDENPHYSLYYHGKRVGVLYAQEHAGWDAVAHQYGEPVQLNHAGPVDLTEARQMLEQWAVEHS